MVVIDVSPLEVAIKVKEPCVPSVTVQPENVATPATALTGFAEQVNVPVPVAIAKVTGAVEVGTTPPAASSTLMTG